MPCEKTYLAGGEIVEQKLDPQTPALRARTGAGDGRQRHPPGDLRQRRRLLLEPRLLRPDLPWVDDSGTQFLPDAAASKMYSIASVPLASHDAILGDAQVGADVVAFVGAP